jgi:hypothetical protein
LSRLALAALPLAVQIAGIALAHFGAIPAMVGFLVFVVGGLIGLIGSIAALERRLRRKPGLSGLATALLALPVLLILVGAAPGFGYPRINDITTDLREPPDLTHAATLPENRGRDMGFPDNFTGIIRSGYPNLKPWTSASLGNNQAYALFERIIELTKARRDWTIAHVDPAARLIEGTATTRLFRFKDDFAIRVRPEGEGLRVDMRSKSRDGQGDLGANATRIQSFFAELDRSLAERPLRETAAQE